MAYREKLAWLTLISMAVTYTLYFSHVARMLGAPSPLAMLVPFGVLTGIQAVIVIIGSAFLGIQANRAGEDKTDERDRAIARRSTTIAYYVLLTGTILVGVVMPFTEPAWRIIQAALLAVVIAEAIKYGVVILSYRRGWHG